jgi:predicted Zn-dependent protease
VTLTRGESQAITRKVMKMAKGDETVVSVTSSQRGNTRFANNGTTTNGDVSRVGVSITSTSAGRSASVSGNATDAGSLERLLRDAEELAALAPVNPEHVSALGKQKYVRVRGRDAKTVGLGAPARAERAHDAIKVALAGNLIGSGLVTHGASTRALATSAGLFAWHESTSATMSTTCRTPDGTGSGRASAVSHVFRDLQAKALAERAAEKAERSKNPQALDPGRYTVILEPQAVFDLLSFLSWSMGARAADEGRSFFSKPGGGTRVGEQLFDPSITIRSDPAHPLHPASPFSQDGQPQVARTWIEAGVLRQLGVSRFWAAKTGQEPVPNASSFHMEGSDRSIDDLVSGVDRGVLVTRFWYNRMVERRTILATGLTRDGTFLVEGGKITKAVKNFRYNESPITLLRNVQALGRPERVDSRGQVVVVPPMVVDGFNFASVSDAV